MAAPIASPVPSAGVAAQALEDAVAAAAAALLAEADRDWSHPAADLTWTVTDTVAHVASCLVGYAGQVHGAPESGWVVPDVTLDATMGNTDAVAWVRVAGAMLAAAVRGAPASRRSFHPYGTSDPAGFACMGVVETLVHTHDVMAAFGTAWPLPDHPAEVALQRLFRDLPDDVVAASPGSRLLWAAGREALGGQPRRTRWRWDGTVPEPAAAAGPAAAVPGTGWWGSVLESPDPAALADFYAALLGWERADTADDWCTVRAPGTTAYLGFHASPEYRRPVWPPVDGEQQAMAHLDVEVHDLAEAVERAVALGAVGAEVQPQPDVRVMLDPDGHPFCLYTND